MDEELADLDLLVDLLDQDDAALTSDKPIINEVSPLTSCQNNVEINPTHTDDVDPLEVELHEMEKKMNMLKEKLKSKNNSFEHSLGTSDKQLTPLSQKKCSKNSFKENTSSKCTKLSTNSKSEIHTGDTDSEDDEDNRNPLEQNFNTYGKEVKMKLATVNVPDKRYSSEYTRSNGSISKIMNNNKTETQENSAKDPFSGINLVNPLVTADAMKELMYNRKMIHMSTINLQTRGGEIDGDWVTIGVIVSKTETKTSQKGSQYCIWQMSDLKDCSKIVSLFLFSAAYKGLWKTSVGTVVGILNPQIMTDRKENQMNILTLSINNKKNVLIMGHSKDFGYCKGRTKQGANCHQFINKSVCEFCMYHVQSEYKKSCAKRADIQSSFSRVDPRKAFQSKILGKSQVFYGGQMYTAPAPSTSTRRASKEKKTLANSASLQLKLKSNQLKESDIKQSFVLKHLSQESISTIQEVSQQSEAFGNMLLAPTVGARNFLKHKVCGPSQPETVSPEARYESVSARDFIKMSQRQINTVCMKNRLDLLKKSTVPKLGRGLSANSNIEFDIMTPVTKMDIKKARAAAVIKAKGPLKPFNPNMVQSKTKASKEKLQKNVNKRLASAIDGSGEKPLKISKGDEKSQGIPFKAKSLLGDIDMNSETMKKILEAKSSHSNLIQDVEDEEMEKYFNGQEKKEMLENKMLSIMEIPTSAVSCLQCKYTSVTASDICKAAGHALKQVKAVKRFFECKNCKRRTTSLLKIPNRSCENCQETNWGRVAMSKGKSGPKLDSEILSLRGDELGHYSGSGNQIYLHV